MSASESADDRGSRPPEVEVGPGTLLLASHDLVEPTFRRTVVYIAEHNEGGTLGVVLNRRSETAVHELFPKWADLAARPKALYIGGPVKRSAAICLATVKPGWHGSNFADVDGLLPLTDHTVMVNLDSDPDAIAEFVEGLRIYVGYAGWSYGQLDDELERDDWIVLPARREDVLIPARTDLWSSVLRRQPGHLRILASHPIELERN